MTKQYVFFGVDVQGNPHTVQLTARNMGVAVAKFMNTSGRPAVFHWRVCSAGTGAKWHPVSRERWGHFYDGYTSPKV